MLTGSTDETLIAVNGAEEGLRSATSARTRGNCQEIASLVHSLATSRESESSVIKAFEVS
jgi:hypothetical protein